MFLRRILPFLSDSRRNCASCSGLLHQIDRRSLVQRMVRRNPQLDGTESQTETLPKIAMISCSAFTRPLCDIGLRSTRYPAASCGVVPLQDQSDIRLDKFPKPKKTGPNELRSGLALEVDIARAER